MGKHGFLLCVETLPQGWMSPESSLFLLRSSSHSLNTPGSPGGSLWWVTTHLKLPGLVQCCRYSLPLSQAQVGWMPLCGQLEKDGGVEPLKWSNPVVPRSVKNHICSLCSRPGGGLCRQWCLRVGVQAFHEPTEKADMPCACSSCGLLDPSHPGIKLVFAACKPWQRRSNFPRSAQQSH